ncbi:hydroxyethylthiazole kinase [Leucobacter sp. M11]|uniref:hydroxyethylthiazole kinase n=1 Tax=Leucobacter sp. M11 TaxID=2993565 RepID=UPI002D7F24F0|nr:hydroxyethylthiazole kinase [Leucobacter sp. M11]MEB4615720.1 hydroxyethylthiazole kinase [Leucobacter sp. M11]
MTRTPKDLRNARPEDRSAALTTGTIAVLAAIRERAPLVQSITNSVVQNVTANALLAVGAAPAMVDTPGEAAVFARLASGLLVNLGTPSAEQRLGAQEAVPAALEAGRPWVLDPVAVGSLPLRTALAAELIGLRPTIIRGNASEILALAGAGAGGRGVDAADDVELALAPARELAARTGAVVAVSGPLDAITDGVVTVRTRNGHPLLTRMTGGGCALGAIMVAAAAVAPDPLTAAVAAHVFTGVAAELAAETAGGPGTFAAHYLDRLADVSADQIVSRAAFG